MSRKPWMSAILALALALVAAQAASAKYAYSYAVKFVCGYNSTNLGIDADGSTAGEPPVKFGNYATEVNIYNFNLYGDPSLTTATIEKRFTVLVKDGFPVGREPKVVDPSGFDRIELTSTQSTMDDCNRIAQVLWGKSPTPYPLTIGYLVILSTVELDVTAVYTSQACSNWVNSPEKLECLDTTGKFQGVSSSIHVNQVQGHKLF
ncbi:MAG: hypothetical protein ACJ76N_06745 [Thermoanaerobaculia bacterium]|jgi:hypothetical protein